MNATAKAKAPTLTQEQFTTVKLAQIDYTIYSGIEEKFARFLGEEKAQKLLNKCQDKTISQISVCKFVDITDCYQLV